jgi:hypothetical protein
LRQLICFYGDNYHLLVGPYQDFALRLFAREAGQLCTEGHPLSFFEFCTNKAIWESYTDKAIWHLERAQSTDNPAKHKEHLRLALSYLRLAEMAQKHGRNDVYEMATPQPPPDDLQR